MNIKTDWKKIRRHFNKSFASNFHVSVASIDGNNNPTVTPIGSLFLNGNQTGFYFEKYIATIPTHASINKNICILAVNSSKIFWLKSLFKGKFNHYPAVKLIGTLGERRLATEIEMSRLNRRMKSTKGLKGNKYLWGDMQYVREITFTEAELNNLGKMTESL